MSWNITFLILIFSVYLQFTTPRSLYDLIRLLLSHENACIGKSKAAFLPMKMCGEISSESRNVGGKIVHLEEFPGMALPSINKVSVGSIRRYNPLEEHGNKVDEIYFEDENGNLKREHINVALDDIDPSSKTSISDLTFYLYTQQNPENGEELGAEDILELTNSIFYSPTRQNVFLIHGWKNSYDSKMNTIIKRSLLKKYDVNVFVVDWSRRAKETYSKAKLAVPSIGAFVGQYINSMMKHFKLTPTNFNLIGHSLGAHVCGAAGSEVAGSVNYIVGLDPAGPLFAINDLDNRLDESDAAYVQVIHTNGALLGLETAIGHSDYYPNGGNIQPGCGLDVSASCSHGRAYEYFAESVMTGGFEAFFCNNYKSFKKGVCKNNHKSFLGTYEIDKSAKGDYYLYVKDKPPHSLS